MYPGPPDHNSPAAPGDPAEPRPGLGGDAAVPEAPRALHRGHHGPQDHHGRHATPPGGRQEQHSQEPGMTFVLYSVLD